MILFTEGLRKIEYTKTSMKNTINRMTLSESR